MTLTQKWILMVMAIGIGLSGYTSEARAQFIGASVDLILAHGGAKGAVNGFTVGITHPVPIMPNLGFLSLSFSDDSDPFELNDESVYYDPEGGNTYSLTTKVDITSFEFFYHIPVPVVSFLVGIGGGIMSINTEILQSSAILETINLSSNIAEGFIRVGLPFWNTLEFHIGIHNIIATPIDVAQGNNTPAISVFDTERDYSGVATTLGLQLAF